jgi:hypothetical protein
MIAVALIVIDVDTRSSGIPLNNVAMSSIESIATPTRPTSPAARAWSESYPICVGRSNATLRPLTPCERRYRYRRFDSVASANPAYCRIVQGRPRYIEDWTPRVNGNIPGRPMSWSGSMSERSAGVR